ncbi:hypothetical protein GCM10010123_36200 [Pilimelia anulata]|uniref:Uncharacterized protein n=1 Tax=Pilimelia anulata TaxID=53371 RepID=A0A8J3BBJ4_9ACTN|nr:DUF6328 family protein [Pilimelia anulata]GGK03014.1 hypothetical protein GCM10010123_36200 [Pilimelia anulata]
MAWRALSVLPQRRRSAPRDPADRPPPPEPAARPEDASDAGRREDERDRWRRTFTELLRELRVAQTGVQILFAFLLILPFNARFTETTGFERNVYLVALLSAAGAAAMIISPVAFHRAQFRRNRKPELVMFAHRMATGGLALTLVAMVSSVLLITDFLLDRALAFALSATVALVFLTLWTLLPHRPQGRPVADRPPPPADRD